jgi:hypothetical protein
MKVQKKKTRVPAYLVKENYNGRRVKVRGEILSLNESEMTADMMLMGKIYKDIPSTNIQVNEAFLDDLKGMWNKGVSKTREVVNKGIEKGKQILNNVFTVIKKVKGKLVSLFGNQVRSNSPLLIAQQFKNEEGFGIWLPASELQLAQEYGIRVQNSDVDEAVQESAESIQEINDFLRLFAKNYRGSEMSIEESWGSEKAKLKRIDEAWGKAVRMVEFNTRLNTGEWPAYPATKWSRREALNEAERESEEDAEWAEKVARGGSAASSKVQNISLDQAVNIIYSNLTNLLRSGDPTSDDNKPLCIWGPPGIGKTVGIKSLIKSMQRFAGKAIETLSDLGGGVSGDSSDEIKKLEQEKKDILRSKGGYKSKATTAKIEQIDAKIKSLQTTSNPSMLYNLSDETYDEAVDKLGDELDDYTTYDEGWDTDVVLNPAEIYITCTGMTKDSFSLPSFTNEGEIPKKEELIANLEKKFKPFNIDIQAKINGENGDKFLSQLDKSFSSKTVLEIPKAWLPMYMPTGDEEIDRILDEETYTMRGMAGSESCNCGVLFIDELSRVSGDVMNILMQLIQQRTYEGGWTLGRKWYIVFASNRLGDMDKHLAAQFSWENAFGRRLMHCNILPKRSEWIKWARSINPNTGKPNIEIDWIIQLLDGPDDDEQKNKLWLDLNDIDPITGENLSAKGKKGTRFTGGANPASWTAVSQKLAYINMFKDMYNDPEGFRYPNGEPLTDREKKKIIRYKQKGELPMEIRGYVTDGSLRGGKLDTKNFNDIMLVVQSIIGTDKDIKDAIEELLDYKSFWTPKRCQEVCKKGKTSDPADNQYKTLPTWKKNLVYIDEIFNLILNEGARPLMDMTSGMEEVRDLAIDYIKEIVDAQANQKANGGAFSCPTYDAYIADNSIDYAGLGFQRNHGKLGKSKNPLSPSMAYYLLSSKMLGKNKTALNDINTIFQNIINYAIMVAEQIQKNAGASEINTQLLGMLIGDAASKYTNGTIYQAFNDWFLRPANKYMSEISFEDVDLHGHDEDAWLEEIRNFAAQLLSVYMNYFVYEKPNALYKEVLGKNEI